jgi:virginiamycin B lyase
MRHRMTGWVALLLCALLVAACGSGTSQTTRSTTPPFATPTPLPSAGTISATFSGLWRPSSDPAAYTSIAVDNTTVWVWNPDSGKLTRIDPTTNTIVATLVVGENGCDDEGCGDVVIGQGAVWVLADNLGTISRIDPQTNRIVATIHFPPKDNSLVFVTPGAVWVTNRALRTISRIDPQTNTVVATLTNQPGPNGVSFGAGSLWMCYVHGQPDGLIRLDPTTMQVQARIDVTAQQGLGCYWVTVLDQVIWVAATLDPDGRTLVFERIDPATNQVRATTPVPGNFVLGVAADAQGAWALDVQGLIRFDPHSAQVIGRLAMTGGGGIAVGAGSVWVAKSDGTLLRITPAP